MSPPRPRVLLIEDDPKTARTVGLYCSQERYEVRHCSEGRTALDEFKKFDPDVVVLDLGLPDVDGRTVCSRLRVSSDVPIIMLTARAGEQDVIAGLDGGADDYVVKPFSPRQLMARIRAAVRRSSVSNTEATDAVVLRFDGLEIDEQQRSVTVDGQNIQLTSTQFDLLRALAAAPGRIFTRDELIDRVSGPTYEGSTRTIDAHVKNIRRRLNAASDTDVDTKGAAPFIETVVGVGYRFARQRLANDL